jgi:SAM-dependent methyltransferase
MNAAEPPRDSGGRHRPGSVSIPACPLCRGKSSRKHGEIAQTVLLDYYRHSLGMDASRMLDGGAEPIGLLQCPACDLKWYHPSPAGDGEFYEGLQRHSWYYQDDKPEYSFARAWLERDSRVLEVGCGKGAFALYAGPGICYRGLEFNQEAVRKGREAGLSIDIETIEAHAAAFPDTYDLVCSFQVLEHVSQPLEFLGSCAAAVKPGGLLLIAVPAEDSFLSITEGGFLNMPPHHLTRWTDRALVGAMGSVGIAPLEVWHEPVADYHRDWYHATLARHALRALLGQGHPLHSRDMISRVINRLLTVGWLREPLHTFGERRFANKGRGHTVCAVGRKTGRPA